jgi:hypothetical protein
VYDQSVKKGPQHDLQALLLVAPDGEALVHLVLQLLAPTGLHLRWALGAREARPRAGRRPRPRTCLLLQKQNGLCKAAYAMDMGRTVCVTDTMVTPSCLRV